ncbi:MAG: toll/interleukin-1 receptor domain-containing protein [Nitrososphaerales archaeon]|nr:toll/interleukin-1 receptor domain-containing protein [Nitrososphaerales archaeon]
MRYGESGQGYPRDSEIAAETVWFLIRRSQITTREKLDEVLSNGLMKEKRLNPEPFQDAIEARHTGPDIDYAQVRRGDFLESIREQVRAQLEKELKTQGTRLENERAIEEADRTLEEKMAKIAALPSVIDGKEFQEPVKLPEEIDTEERLEWWEKLHLTANPFKERQGLYGIEPQRFDSVIVKTPLFQKYIRYMDELPQELFKSTVFFGIYGSGKSAILQYLQRAAALRQIDTAFLRLSGYGNFDGFRAAFEEQFAAELRRILGLGESGQELSLKELMRRLGQKPKFNGILVFIDNLNKLDVDAPAALTFLKYLQAPKDEYFDDVSGKLGFYVAGALSWKETISSDSSYSASLVRRETIAPITVDEANEMLNKRLESFYPNPEVKRAIRVDYVEQVYTNLVVHKEELTFRKFMERLEFQFDHDDFTALAFDPVKIPAEILSKIRGVFQRNQTLSNRFRTLLEDRIKGDQRNRSICIRLLTDIFRNERTKRLRDEDIAEARNLPYLRELETQGRLFYLKALESALLISRVDDGDHQHSWAVCQELEDVSKAIAEQYPLSLDDYLFKIYGIPQVIRQQFRMSKEIEQIKAFSEECEADSRDMLAKILALHTEIVEALAYYTERTTNREVLSKCIESLNVLTQFFVTFVERSDESPADHVDLTFWENFWNFPDDVADFQRRIMDEEDCVHPDNFWNTIGSYNRAFKTLFEFVRKEYHALSWVHVSSNGLDNEDAKALVEARDKWIAGKSEECVGELREFIEKKTRIFVNNVMTLVYGDFPNRLKHADAKSREKILASVNANQQRRASWSRETDLLSLSDLVRLMTNGSEDSPGCWQQIFCKIFHPATVQDITRYHDSLLRVEAGLAGGVQTPGREASDLREVISLTADLTRKMNAGYLLLLKSLYIVPEGTGTSLYFNLTGPPNKAELSGIPFQLSVAKTVVDGMPPGKIRVGDAEFIQSYYSRSVSYRDFCFYLAVELDEEKAGQLGLVVSYSLDDVSGSYIHLKRIFKFNKENPPRIALAHSGKDRAFVEKLATDLRGYRVEVWADNFDLKDGNPIRPVNHPQMEEGDSLGVVLSQDSVKSAWVREDLIVELVKELEEKKISVLPIMYKKCEVPDAIIGRFVIDFMGSYKRGVEDLLTRIESGARARPPERALVFIAHSFADESFKNTLRDALLKKNMRVYAAEEELSPGTPIQDKVRVKIQESDYVVAIYTKANPSSGVDQEVGIALGLGKPVIPIMEKGLHIGFTIQPLDRLEFDQADFEAVCGKVATKLAEHNSGIEPARAA